MVMARVQQLPARCLLLNTSARGEVQLIWEVGREQSQANTGRVKTSDLRHSHAKLDCGKFGVKLLPQVWVFAFDYSLNTPTTLCTVEDRETKPRRYQKKLIDNQAFLSVRMNNIFYLTALHTNISEFSNSRSCRSAVRS